MAQTYPTCLFGSTIAPVATRNSVSLSRKAGAGGHEVRDHELTGEVSERIPLDHTTRYLVPRALQPNHPQIRDPFALPTLGIPSVASSRARFRGGWRLGSGQPTSDMARPRFLTPQSRATDSPSRPQQTPIWGPRQGGIVSDVIRSIPRFPARSLSLLYL